MKILGGLKKLFKASYLETRFHPCSLSGSNSFQLWNIIICCVIGLNSQGVEMCNCHVLALSNAHECSFSQVPYLEWEEKITDLSNFVNNET